MNIIDLWIPGEPATAGSKKHVGNGILVDSSGKKGVAWRTAVQDAARKVHAGPPIKDTPLAMLAFFYRNRPKGHYGARGNVKPRYKSAKWAGRPDATKLVRAIEDALNKVLYHDDSQIVLSMQMKLWCDDTTHGPGARVLVCQTYGYHDVDAVQEIERMMRHKQNVDNGWEGVHE